MAGATDLGVAELISPSAWRGGYDGIVAERRERSRRHVAGSLHGSLLFGMPHQDRAHGAYESVGDSRAA